ncbi:MAG: hypothetical protein M3167_16695 [Acidobacteriota bacterium]|nr:hypothetical protein [Acidobacteriota bacterium]
MKRSGLFLIAAAFSASAQVNPKNMDTAAHPRPWGSTPPAWGSALSHPPGPGPVHPELRRLWKTLPGRYEQSEGDSHLSLALTAVTPYALSVQTRTGSGDLEKGWIVLADVSPSYRSQKVRFALEYRPDSLRSELSCILYGAPTADGITFESEGSDCSFPLGRRVSKVKIDLSADGIALSETDSRKEGEALVLRRVGKS